MMLKPRLDAVFRSVPINSVVADIGTDHAFLPIALVKGKIAKKVIACDVNQRPLEVARANIQSANAENIELRLSDGLQKIKSCEVDVITVCGLGGDVIKGIISKYEWVKNKNITLLLQANSSADELRRWLFKNGFEIVRETGVFDNGKSYSVITARYCDKEIPHTLAEVYIGKLALDKSDASKKYITLQYNRIISCLSAISDIPSKAQQVAELIETAEEIKAVLDNF